MKWGLITDTHNHRIPVEKAINIFKREHCSHVFHCGDFENDDIFDLFQNNSFDFHYVTDHKSHDSGLKKNKRFFVEKIDRFTVGMMHDTYEKINYEGRYLKVEDFISHDIFDYFFYGHLHYLNFKLPSDNSKTIAVNSGGLYFTDSYYPVSTICILNPLRKILEVYYYHNSSYRFIFTIIFHKKMEDCIEIKRGKALTKFSKMMEYQSKALRINDYSFSYLVEKTKINHNTDHLWFNKNLDNLLDLI